MAAGSDVASGDSTDEFGLSASPDATGSGGNGQSSVQEFVAQPDPTSAMDSFRVLKTRRIGNITAFRFCPVRPSRMDGATGGRPLIEFENLGLTGRPVAATCWPFLG